MKNREIGQSGNRAIGKPRARRRHEVHVFKEAGSNTWVVASAGRRASRHRRQGTAIGVAIRTAKRRHVDVNIHARSGRIRSKNSYGNESPQRDGDH